MKNLLSVIAISSAVCAAAMPVDVTGPDGRLALIVDVAEGVPVYSVTYDGKSMITTSPLGFKADIGDFSQSMKMTDARKGSIDKQYTQDRIKKSEIDYKANTLVTDFTNADGSKMSIEWQVADNDISFRYLLPVKGETRSAVIEDEKTAFAFPEFTTTFLTPQSDPMIGWKRTKPSYEENYKADAPMTDNSEYGHGYTFPALFHVGDNGWVLVSETGVDGSYCASRLGDFTDGAYEIEYPMPEENNGNGSSAPGIKLPGATPWRTITVGSDLEPIVETTAAWNVLEPLYSGHKANNGKGVWSWIMWQDNSINSKDQKTYIDFAADMGYRTALIDNWWDNNIGREGMKELADYAAGKGVKLGVWYSSSGWWNDIEQGPINLMSRPIKRKEEMKWLKSLGVDLIKVDFFGGDKQETMRLYEDILSDAADYGIDVIFHGCTLPRGWERLYPNYVGSEAVLASENLMFMQSFCDAEAFNATLHPFIRNTVGSMEYGGTVLNKRFGRDNNSGNYRRTGDAFQLATSILFQNAVQNFALAPNNLYDAPAEAIEFMKNVPTTWDDVDLVEGYPGRYVVLARRSGDTWYIAAVNALDKPQKVNIDLSAFGFSGTTVPMYADDKDLKFKYSDARVKKSSSFPIEIQPNGGVVLVVKP